MEPVNFTIKDIARRVGVSTSTVSRALNNHPRIGLQMKEKVQHLAKQLNYSPNPSAKNLQRKKSGIIGVVVPDISTYFFSQLISGAEAILQQKNYNLIICQSNDQEEKELKLIDLLLQQRVEGLLICVSQETSNVEFYNTIKQKIPLVFFDRELPAIHSHKIFSDDFAGAITAVEHLIDRGCKKIAHFAGPSNISNSLFRLNGYLHALEKKFVKEKKVIHTLLDQNSSKVAMRQLLLGDFHPDGIFAYNDYVAYDIIEVAKEFEIDIGNEIKFVGFANEPVSTYMSPALTTIAQPAYGIGSAAAEILYNEIISPNHGEIKKQALPTNLIIRKTT